MTKLLTPNRHTGGSRYPDAFEIPGFRVALAIASLPGMTIELFREFLSHHTSPLMNNKARLYTSNSCHNLAIEILL
jgi:hypothetical protein